jgi:hypothetical protein
MYRINDFICVTKITSLIILERKIYILFIRDKKKKKKIK